MSLQGDDHSHNPDFPSSLELIYHKLQHEHPIATEEILISRDGLNVLAARRPLQDDSDSDRFRASLASLLELDTFNIIQVVGDSGSAFSLTAIERISEVICDQFDPTTVLEYGYTASQHDTNWIVNDLVSKDGDLARKTIANVVYESAIAVREWGCEATGYVKSFVLAYDETQETRFGDDLFLSDDIMEERYGDKIICVEGGVQAFEQVCGVLKRGVKVVAVTGNLRAAETRSKFSAARLLKDCADLLRVGGSHKRIESELMDGLRSCGMFDGREEMYKRVAYCLRRVMIRWDRAKDVEIVLVD